MSAPIVEVSNVHNRFEVGDVLRGVSLTLSHGETFVIMGGSGTGKTVLLRCIAGLLRPDWGRIRLFGHNIERLEEEELLPLRRRLGYVFQGAALFDSQTVYENVAFPLQRLTRLTRAQIDERVDACLEMVHLERDAADKMPAADRM